MIQYLCLSLVNVGIGICRGLGQDPVMDGLQFGIIEGRKLIRGMFRMWIIRARKDIQVASCQHTCRRKCIQNGSRQVSGQICLVPPKSHTLLGTT